MEQQKDKENNQGKEKTYTIYVNTREKKWTEKKISYEEVIVLAYGKYIDDEVNVYTVIYTKGEEGHHEGSLTKGKSTPVKDGMIFDVTHTNRS